MEFEALKRSVERIEMSEEMQNRIVGNCRAAAVCKRGKIAINNRENVSVKKIVTIAAVVALCLCASVVAASRCGCFKDVANWTGAVTGTKYVQATNEIKVHAAAERGVLTVTAEFLAPDVVPYREQEALSVGAYQIVDASGDVVDEGEGDDFAELVDGKAVMTVPLGGLADGTYRLQIQSFVGTKKADQPLEISGAWECAFSLNG